MSRFVQRYYIPSYDRGYVIPTAVGVTTVNLYDAPKSNMSRSEHKDWYLDMISAELEALPDGPHKTEANAALRQMVARMVVLEEAIEAAKVAKAKAISDQAKAETEKIAEKAKAETETKKMAAQDTSLTHASADSHTCEIASSQLQPKP